MKEHILDIRGIKRARLVDYFSQMDRASVSGDYIRGDNWEVQIGEEQELQMGSVKLPLVKLVFHMDDKAYQVMLQDFRIKFSCMGG
jgi:hypothetical protein